MGLQQITDRVAIVTGGASGIGRGIAEALLAAGARVAIADIEAGALSRTAQEIGAFSFCTDVTDPTSLKALSDAVMGKFGRIDIVCNNAGVGSTARIEDMTLDDWRWVLEVNLYGVINGIRQFLPILTTNPEGGHIVNTASMGGYGTMPTMGAYSASKFAVVAITETLNQELATHHPKVHATVLVPGPIRSNIGHSRRNRPQALDAGALQDTDLDELEENFGGAIPWKDPADAGHAVVDAIRSGAALVTTHPEMLNAVIGGRHAVLAGAISG